MKNTYKEKPIFQDSLPHTFISNSSQFSDAIILCDRGLIKNIGNKPALLTEQSRLREIIGFYKKSYSSTRLTLLTNNSFEAIIGIDEEIRVTLNGQLITADKLSFKERSLKKVELSSKEALYKHAGSALFSLLTDYPFTSVTNAVDILHSLNQQLDVIWALDTANKIVNSKENKLLTSKRITRKDYIKTRMPVIKPQSYITGEFGNIFIDNGSTGTGKSQRIRETVKASIKNNLQSIFICHRRTISAGSLKGINGVGYYDKLTPGDEDEIKCLVIVVNSILRPNFESFLKKVDLVILEEGKQVFDHVMAMEFKEADKINSKVSSLCEQAKTIIIADADSNNETIAFAQSLKKDGDVRLLSYKADFSDIILEMNSYELIESAIYASTIQNNFQPFLLACDRKDKVVELNNELQSKNPKLNILTVTGDNNKQDKQLAFIASPNDVSKQYDIIIYNSAMTSSVSLTTSRFKKHFGLFEGIITSSNVIQMLRRNRTCKYFQVGIKRRDKLQLLKIEDIREDLSEFEYKCKLWECDEAFNKDNNISALYFNALHEGFNVKVSRQLKPEVPKPILTDIEQNIFILSASIEDCTEYDKNDIRPKTKRINMVLKHEFYHLIFDALNINKQNFSGSFSQPQANQLLTIIYSRSGDYKKIKLTTLNRNGQPKTGTNSVVKILKKFGLEASRVNSSDGLYKINKDSEKYALASLKKVEYKSLTDIY